MRLPDPDVSTRVPDGVLPAEPRFSAAVRRALALLVPATLGVGGAGAAHAAPVAAVASGPVTFTEDCLFFVPDRWAVAMTWDTSEPEASWTLSDLEIATYGVSLGNSSIDLWVDGAFGPHADPDNEYIFTDTAGFMGGPTFSIFADPAGPGTEITVQLLSSSVGLWADDTLPASLRTADFGALNFFRYRLGYGASDCWIEGTMDTVVSGVTADADGDGFIDAAYGASDCDDGDPSINVFAAEICDGVDNDCTGAADDGLTVIQSWPDRDGDGWGDRGASPTVDCAVPVGFVENDGDCYDWDASISPDAVEVCDFDDNNCDGTVDEGHPYWFYYPDADGDLFGDAAAVPDLTCAPAAGWLRDNTDCDDTDAGVNPGVVEDPTTPPGADEDCDGLDISFPTSPGFTYTTDASGAVTATSTVVPGASIVFPPGAAIGGATLTSTSTGGVTVVQVEGAELNGGTKEITLPLAFQTIRAFSGKLHRSVEVCVIDAPSASVTAAYACDAAGGTLWILQDLNSAGEWYTWHNYRSLLWADFSPGTWVEYLYGAPVPDPLEVTNATASARLADFVYPAYTFSVRPFFWSWPVSFTRNIPTPTTLHLTVGELSHTTFLVYDDADNDGVADYDEGVLHGTDPTLADSDGDGVVDGDELALGVDPLDASDVADPDADGDGMSAGLEASFGTDPNAADSDGDGVPDPVELADGTDPTSGGSAALQDADGNGMDDRAEDADGDGLSDAAEAELGTDPQAADSDGDGVWDLFEVLDGTDAGDASDAALVDEDGDGVDDRNDNCVGTENPDQVDGDGDGVGAACDPDEQGEPDTGDTGGSDGTDGDGDDGGDGDPTPDSGGEPAGDADAGDGAKGCGCASRAAGPASLPALLMAGLLLVRRRRRV